jgi:hypothetical protein
MLRLGREVPSEKEEGLAAVLVKMSITPSMLVVLHAATPSRLFKLVALFLRLPTALAVAVNCLSEIFLGLVDTLGTIAVVIARRRRREQQPYS